MIVTTPTRNDKAPEALAFSAAAGTLRLDARQATSLLRHAPLLTLAAAAGAMRDRLHPER